MSNNIHAVLRDNTLGLVSGMLEVAAALALAQQCAPTVAPETLLAVVQTESRYNPNAIGVNRGARLVRQPASRGEAMRVAAALQRAGANFDAGLGQINSSNFGWLGLTVETVFDPCRNLAAAGRVLEANYKTASRSAADPQSALRAALSMYNTGSPARGFSNGYVLKVETSARLVVPALARVSPVASAVPPSAAPDVPADRVGAGTVAPAAVSLSPPPPTWDVFGRAQLGARFVFDRPNDSEPDGSEGQEHATDAD